MATTLEELRQQIGETSYSEWIEVDQGIIDRFADATFDRQFIHVDPERAAQTPFGGTIAHGFLTLSLLSHLGETAPGLVIEDARMSVNYGFDRVRFISPVRSGSRIRAAFTTIRMEEKRPNQFQRAWEVTVEIEGVDKPALTAVWLNQFFL
jgi:acyl dehydratase